MDFVRLFWDDSGISVTFISTTHYRRTVVGGVEGKRPRCLRRSAAPVLGASGNPSRATLWSSQAGPVT